MDSTRLPPVRVLPVSTKPAVEQATLATVIPLKQTGFPLNDLFVQAAAARAATAVTRDKLTPTAVKNAVVIGAGPAGLLAALELLQNGANVTIVEQRDMYTRPIHFNVRPNLLHRLAETVPQVLPKILEKLGTIERAELIDGTITALDEKALADIKAANPGREITVGPGGMKIGMQPAGIPTPNPELADFGGRSMLASPSVGQIWVADFESILFEELDRLSKEPSTGDKPRVTILRDTKPELKVDMLGNYSVTAYGVKGAMGADGKAVWEPTGVRTNLGTPDLVVVAEGANSETRKAEDIPRTFLSEGAVYIAASIDGAAITDKSPHGGLIRRRYAEMTDPKTGEVFGIRQIVVGHSKRAKTWCLVEVPKFMNLENKEQVDKFYREQAALVLERPLAELQSAHIAWGPNSFVMQQFISKTAVKGNNMVFMGDAVGNAHFLTSGGLMTACVPHLFALEKLLRNLSDGVPRKQAMARFDKWTMTGTKEWLRIGFAEFGRNIAAANFGEAFSDAFKKARERLGLPNADTKKADTSEQKEHKEQSSPLSGESGWNEGQQVPETPVAPDSAA